MRETLTAEQALLALAAAPSGEGRWPRICARLRPQERGEAQAQDCREDRGERGRGHVL